MANNKKFCRVACREAHYKPKRKENSRRYLERHTGLYSPDKCQCLICGKWYVQVGTHIVQKHEMTCREYREYFELEVKKGVVPAWYRKMKGDQAIANETWKNLKSGEEYRFIKGDNMAGRYTRSPITIERIRGLGKFRKEAKNEKNYKPRRSVSMDNKK